MRVRDYEVAVGRCTTPEALWALVVRFFFSGTAVERLIYLHLPPVGAPDENTPALAAAGWTEGLVRRLLAKRLFRHSPGLRHARSSSEPAHLDDLLADPELTPGGRDFIAELHAHGLDAGVSIPVYGPYGRAGHCCLGLRAGTGRLEPAMLRQYQWVCQLAHLRYCDMLQAMRGPPPFLSEREIEVLALVTRGKTNTMIGEILGISSHTVDAHLRRIYQKLGVFDRISAALRAVGLGLIRAE
jgi:LuxR family transcriptional regulator, quorum-sensing system regulator CciR